MEEVLAFLRREIKTNRREFRPKKEINRKNIIGIGTSALIFYTRLDNDIFMYDVFKGDLQKLLLALEIFVT